jgi:hypothetical protein
VNRQEIIDCLEDALYGIDSKMLSRPWKLIVSRRVVKEAIELIKFQQQQVDFLQRKLYENKELYLKFPNQKTKQS